jgi:hypothetical protein
MSHSGHRDFLFAPDLNATTTPPRLSTLCGKADFQKLLLILFNNMENPSPMIGAYTRTIS